jgi:hypothetical protein
MGGVRSGRNTEQVGGRETLLVNFMECNPVGHAIEALRYALGYHRADPSLRIAVLLAHNTPTELAALCPFVEAACPVALPAALAGEPELVQAIAAVPRRWDWIVDNPRRHSAAHMALFPNFARLYAVTDRYLHARRGHSTIGVPPPAYAAHQQLRLRIPLQRRAAARRLLGQASTAIAVMPAGNSQPRWEYPSTTSWTLLLDALARQHPDARLCLVGKLRADQRTRSSFGPDELARLLAAFPRALDCFDLPLVDQLAVVEACDLFVAPHTGFGMAALAVGTPWLALSGGRWHEFFCNGVPFYSVFPDPDASGSFTGFDPPPLLAADADGEGPRIACMSRARVLADLDELLAAARWLVGGQLGYQDAMARHFSGLLRAYHGDRSKLWSLDDAHLAYV